MRIAGIESVSCVNGDGVRFVVFVQGCAHHCPGCQNPDTWDFRGGHEVSAESIASMYKTHANLLDGITLSGGDPMYQQDACCKLLDLLPGVNVWVYTGFRYEEIAHTPLAQRADVIVDGLYIESQKCEGKPYGSKNQRVVRKTEC